MDNHPTQEELEEAVPPVPGAALVVQRWNSWVRVYYPDTDESEWVNLAEVEFEPV